MSMFRSRRVDLGSLLEQVVLIGVLAIAALISYTHLRDVWIAAGSPWPGFGPLLVDGLFAAAWLRMRRRRRNGEPVGWLAWGALGLALVATLAGNVAAAIVTGHTSWLSIVVAAWPALAFALVWELVTGHGRGKPPATTATPVAPPVPRPAMPARLASATPLADGPGPWGRRKVADLVAERHTAPPASQPVATRVASQRPATLRQSPAASVTARAGTGGENATKPETDVEKATRLIASDTGRPTLARELAIEPHHARALLDDAKAGVLDDPKDLAERLSRYQDAARAARARRQKEGVSA